MNRIPSTISIFIESLIRLPDTLIVLPSGFVIHNGTGLRRDVKTHRAIRDEVG